MCIRDRGIAECVRQGLPPGEHQSIWLSNARPCLGMVSRWVLEVVHLVNTEFAPCKSGWHAIRGTRTPLLGMQHSFVRIMCASFGRLIFLTWVKPSVASVTNIPVYYNIIPNIPVYNPEYTILNNLESCCLKRSRVLVHIQYCMTHFDALRRWDHHVGLQSSDVGRRRPNAPDPAQIVQMQMQMHAAGVRIGFLAIWTPLHSLTMFQVPYSADFMNRAS